MRSLATLAIILPLATLSIAQSWPSDLVGTWSTKSNKTLTGPGFYDPVNEQMFEPSHTGISYSFTADGFFEEAYYRAISNPQNPKCPSGIMQWQHGKWSMAANGSLLLDPIGVDGRQLLSSPCEYDNAVFTRYNQNELFQRYSVYVDPFHNIRRLDLFKFDGSPMNPMYLAMSPPQMLPTTTLNPTNPTSPGVKATDKGNAKRALEVEIPLAWTRKLEGNNASNTIRRINADRLWWVGLAMTGIGGVMYLVPTRRRLGRRA